MNSGLTLGTRGSPLAMAQATKVASAIEVANRWAAGDVAITAITTSGDRIQDRPLADIGGKALWTKELDRALAGGDIDLSVHSLKDVETKRPEAIRLVAVRPRADVRDRIIGAESIDALKRGAVVGTSSPRRKAQLLRLRPDLRIVPLRGNIDTRLGKLANGDLDAIILAAAGLIRLGKKGIGSPIPVEVMLPAPGQAVIAVECRADDSATVAALQLIDDESTHVAINAERAFTAALGGTCHSPIAALATAEPGKIRLRAQLLAEDGSDSVTDELQFAPGDDEAPRRLAYAMIDRAPDIIQRLFEAG